jgi:Na+/proline symporter
MPLVMTVSLAAVLTVWVGLGLGATAMWADGNLHLSSPDQLAPAFLSAAGGTLLALALIAVAAAVMSTAATLMNLVAAAVVRDLPSAVGRVPARSLWPARAATVAVGLFALLLAFHTERTVGLLGVLGWGTFTAALLPSILVGLNWSGATRSGCLAALVIGPLTQLALELAHSGHLMLRWEPGLTGAAIGTLALVGLSVGGKKGCPEIAPTGAGGEDEGLD